MRLGENGQCPECKRGTYGRVRYNADFLRAGLTDAEWKRLKRDENRRRREIEAVVSERQ